ncbi:MAG: sulfatase-like hydrolase/transferase, partial [Phycisphaerae bacterium]|nr:sulfatase-like hydrolase/transferase [Phycisphaerae bacterium]
MNHKLTNIILIALLTFAATLYAAPQKPNVLLIMVDDLGYYDLSCYGHPKIKTPVLDSLAKGGMRLTSFYAGATVCTPSRIALMTGSYPSRLGWEIGVMGFKMGFHEGLSPEAITIAEIFKSEGYATAISGKWHIGDQPETRPGAQGFDFSYYSSHSNNQTRKTWRGDEVVEEKNVNKMLTEQFTTEAIRFLKDKKDKPFFLYLPYTAPHFPVEPHPDWQGKSDYGKYGDVVEEVDYRIGEIIKTLKELKVYDNTIIVFISDNGPNPHEKSGCLPYRGSKWSALEGGTRVPGIV